MRLSFWKAAAGAILAAAIAASPALPAAPAHADAGAAEVHVALFIKTNSYSASAGAATLSAEGGLSLSDGAGAEWLRTEGAAAVRATFDGWRVVVAETADATLAAALVQGVRQASQPVAAFEHAAGKSAVYAVEAGPYGSKAAAESARAALAGNAALAARLAGAQMALRGPFYARASSHASEAEALAAAAPLRVAGIYAVPVVTTAEGGAARYELWIGGAEGETELQRRLAAAQAAVPGIAATPVASTVRYAALRSDRASEGAVLGASVRHVAVGGDGAKLVAAPLTDRSAVRVAERFGRSYRGAVDVFAHGGALAVVNRVDLEAYVASVVGAELDPAWPVEALKAQAVAARTYVLKQGWKYGVAHVTDTTFDQAYYGVSREAPNIVEAARATAGERLRLPDGALLDAFYHSNAGGRTADPAEVWGTPIPGIGSTPSPDDIAERGKLPWYRVALEDGRIGYIRSDLVRLTGGTNAAGFPTGVVTEADVNIRHAPFVNNDTNAAFAALAADTPVTVIDREAESTAYQWIRGPFDAGRLRQMAASSGVSGASAIGNAPIREVEVTARGASSRVTGVAVNGSELATPRPEQYRSMFGLPSGRFEVEQTAKIGVLGAGGRTADLPAPNGSSALYVAGAGGTAKPIAADAYLIADGSGEARVATVAPAFRFHGSGFGHGLGMSQWGAYGLAELGYDYRKILQYYYKDAIVSKE